MPKSTSLILFYNTYSYYKDFINDLKILQYENALSLIIEIVDIKIWLISVSSYAFSNYLILLIHCPFNIHLITQLKFSSIEKEKFKIFQHLSSLMINKQNCHHYLRCLVKMAEDMPLKCDEIPKEFIDFFSLPGLSQCINISFDNIPEMDMDKVEDFFKNKSFTDFDDVATEIRSNFKTEIEKLYASFYYVTQNVKYDDERKNMENRDYLSIQKIFNIKKGVCVEFAKYFRELIKRVGINTKKTKILCFSNASKGDGWDSYSPPSKPNINHESNYIKFGNQSYLSDPTWGSSSKDNCRSFFLIPYYKGILNSFPEDDSFYEFLNCNFTWDQFTSLNKPNISRDLCFESNLLQLFKELQLKKVFMSCNSVSFSLLM